MTRRNASATALAAILAMLPLAAVAGSSLTIALDAPPYALASTCDLSQPLIFVNLQVGNAGNVPTLPRTITATDTSGAFQGQVAIGSILPSQMQTAVQLPMTHVASSSAPIAGAHTIVVSSGLASATVVVTIPATLCPAVMPGGGTTPGGLSLNGGYARLKNQRRNIVVAVVLPAPSNVEAVRSSAACGAHAGTLGALFCPDMIKSGNLLLGWDYHSEGHAIDGFRIYAVNGGEKQLVDHTTGNEALRLSDLKPPSGGYTGACYAVAAYAGTAESELSARYCFNSSAEVAKTVHLTATNVVSMDKVSGKNLWQSSHSSSGTDGQTRVGFVYYADKAFYGDTRSALITRLGVRFDAAPLSGHRIVSAKLRIAFSAAANGGDAHSCATNVGRGENEWWFPNARWIEGFFGDDIFPGDAAPEIAADVTPIVTHWVAFNENQGLVLKNDDENLGAFTNKECLTHFSSNPADYVLDVTYY